MHHGAESYLAWRRSLRYQSREQRRQQAEVGSSGAGREALGAGCSGTRVGSGLCVTGACLVVLPCCAWRGGAKQSSPPSPGVVSCPALPRAPQEWHFPFEEPSSSSSAASSLSNSGSGSSQANLAAARRLMQQAHVALVEAMPARALQRHRPAQLQPAHHPADWQYAVAVQVDSALRRAAQRYRLVLLAITALTALHRMAFP